MKNFIKSIFCTILILSFLGFFFYFGVAIIWSCASSIYEGQQMSNKLEEINKFEKESLAQLKESFPLLTDFEEFDDLYSGFLRNWVDKEEFEKEIVSHYNSLEESEKFPENIKGLRIFLLISFSKVNRNYVQFSYAEIDSIKQSYNSRYIVKIIGAEKI